MQNRWKEGEVVADWRDVIVIPIPKKGNLEYDNWHDISWLEEVGKVFVKIIERRLQVIAS